jgi:two-component system sensor histidine kinase/response regulator
MASPESKTSEIVQMRAKALAHRHLRSIRVQTDRLFAGLLLFQWCATILVAWTVSPRAWDGESTRVHPHVWAAILLGGIAVVFPIFLALRRSGSVLSRHAVAVAQMVLGGLLIHVTGGRIETHFHVFGSLAFLAFYRDWKVLATASLVAVGDHLLRGMFWPLSIYGISVVSPVRWLEHAGWVIFEDIFLIFACLRGVEEAHGIAMRQALLEETRESIEQTVKQRTAALTEQTSILLATTEELRESQKRFHGAFDFAACGMAIVALDGMWSQVNRALCQMLGYAETELLRMDWQSITHPEDVAEDLENVRKLLVGQIAYYHMRKRFVRKGGDLLHAILSVSLVRDAAGEPRYFVSQIVDVSAQEKAQDQLHRFFSTSENLLCIGGFDGYQRRVNRVFPRLLGFPEEEFLSRPILDFVHPDDREATAEAISKLATGSSVLSFEHRCLCKEGSYRWILWNSTSDLGEQRFYATGHDITDRKEAERELAVFRLFAEASQQGFGMATLDGVSSYMNAALKRFLGIPADESAVGTSIVEASLPETRERIEKVILPTTLEKGQWSGEITIHSRDGSEMPTFANVFLVRDKAGAPYFLAYVLTDITQVKLAERELKGAKEAAEAANRAKSEFLANMSHEIRTPMNGVIGMTELLLDTELSAEQLEYASAVKVSSESLLTVINDILDFSKIEAGKLDMEAIDFELRGVIGTTSKTLAVRAYEKGLELAYHVFPEVPEGLVGDPGRLRQVLVNLIGNAIKFTERGEVVVRVEREERIGSEVILKFSVADTGIGIPHDKQQLIFDAFSQADGSVTRKYGGTGLGLAISMHLVERMGGRIWVESEPGKGSTFCFTARFGTQGAQPIQAIPPVLQGMSVLVIDDNATNRRILRDVLVNWGMLPTLVESGSAGLAALKKAASIGSPYELVLLDLMMPEMDGFQVAASIKSDLDLPPTAIVILSSSLQKGDSARCKEIGVEICLVKPILQAELLKAIKEALNISNLSRRRSAVRRIEPATPTRPLRILLAEDNIVNQRVAVRLLEKKGHTTTVAVNGLSALRKLEEEAFDVVLMDMQMPEMDGFEATRRIRKRDAERGVRTPIIAMTAHVMKGDRERCLEAGMDDYVSKPVHAPELFAALDRVAGKLAAAASPPIEAFVVPALDRESALARLDGDEAFFAELTRLFLEDAPELLRKMDSAIGSGDGDGLQRAAHGMKSAAGYLGATAVVAAAGTLETLASRHELELARDRLRELNHQYERLLAALRIAEPAGQLVL